MTWIAWPPPSFSTGPGKPGIFWKITPRASAACVIAKSWGQRKYRGAPQNYPASSLQIPRNLTREAGSSQYVPDASVDKNLMLFSEHCLYEEGAGW